MRLSLFIFLALIGCRDAVVDPVESMEPPLDLSPPIVGEWSGVYDGALGLLGVPEASVRDTFRLVFDIRRVGVEFVYDGEVLRGGSDPRHMYGCGPAPLIVTLERRVRFDCVQGTQLGDTLVLRVEAYADPTFQVMQGVVRDGLEFEGAEYAVELRRVDP